MTLFSADRTMLSFTLTFFMWFSILSLFSFHHLLVFLPLAFLPLLFSTFLASAVL
jgi:hypothetical protein